jgi:hypothetical protein
MAMNSLAEAGAAVKLKDFGKVAEHYESFTEAASNARRSPGSKVRPSLDGNGYWLIFGGQTG